MRKRECPVIITPNSSSSTFWLFHPVSIFNLFFSFLFLFSSSLLLFILFNQLSTFFPLSLSLSFSFVLFPLLCPSSRHTFLSPFLSLPLLPPSFLPPSLLPCLDPLPLSSNCSRLLLATDCRLRISISSPLRPTQDTDILTRHLLLHNPSHSS